MPPSAPTLCASPRTPPPAFTQCSRLAPHQPESNSTSYRQGRMPPLTSSRTLAGNMTSHHRLPVDVSRAMRTQSRRKKETPASAETGVPISEAAATGVEEVGLQLPPEARTRPALEAWGHRHLAPGEGVGGALAKALQHLPVAQRLGLPAPAPEAILPWGQGLELMPLQATGLTLRSPQMTGPVRRRQTGTKAC